MFLNYLNDTYFKPEVRAVRIARMVTRIAFAIVLAGAYLWLRLAYDTHVDATLFISIWLGATVGFTTNVIVTWSVLIVFVPLMKPRIARSLSESLGEQMGDGMANTAGIVGTAVPALLVGLFAPLTIPVVLGGAVVSRLVGVGAKKITRNQINKSFEEIEDRVCSMTNSEIACTMDRIIGILLVIMEALGAGLGALAGWMFHGLYT